MKTLYLIDGHAQFFRAFHAIRTPMSSPVTKEPTNATFGFVGMLLKLLRQLKPDYIAVAIDVSGDKETFRSELYPEYKANRSEIPEALPAQIDRCIALLRAISIPVIGIEGFEADDAIATIATKLSHANGGPNSEKIRVRIVSKDKDLQQLLEENRVEMYDVHTDELIDVKKLKEDKGVTPLQVIDMLALMGDAVDNVPGVPGVGPKTAAELIAQYGSIDNLLAHAHEIKGKRGENIRAAADKLPLSRTLVTLRHDVPIDFDLAAANAARIDLNALLPILRELGFNRYQDEVKQLLAARGIEVAGPSEVGRHTVADHSSSARDSDPPGADSRAAQEAEAMRIAGAKRESRPTSVAPGQGGLFDTFATAELAAENRAKHAEPKRGSYTCITTQKQLDALVQELRAAPIFAVDTETTGLSPRDAALCGVSVSTTPGTGYYIPTLSPTPDNHLDSRAVLNTLRPILEDPAKPKCGHNLKYDLLIFRAHGVELRIGLPPQEAVAESPGAKRRIADRSEIPTSPSDQPEVLGFDSMVGSFLVDAGRSSHSLNNLALALLNYTCIPITDLIGSGKGQRTFDTAPIDLATDYAAEDADIALRLHDAILPDLRAMGLMKLLNDVEMPLVDVLAELEWNGITVDPRELDRQAARLNARIDELRAAIVRESPRPFNPDSPKQLAAILFNKTDDPAEPGLGLKPPKKTKTGFSTDSEVLEKLEQDPAVTTKVPELILEYRQLTKLVGTYLVALKEAINAKTGRIHSSFHQTVAATGRLASSDPNLQNIPIRTDVGREIRKAFIAAPGCVLIGADYSQIELRMLAHLSRDPALIEAFQRDEDIHAAVAAQIHNVALKDVTKEQRNSAKMVNFGIVYGVTPFGLARRLGIDNDAAATIINDYKKRFSGITTFLQECIEQARRFGYVETILGRRRPIADIDSRNPAHKSFAERIAINSVVQGSAADLIKLAMIDLHARLSEHAPHWRANKSPEIPGVKMLLQIHDELVFEAPDDVAERTKQLIVARMEAAMSLRVPLKAEAACSKTWFEGK